LSIHTGIAPSEFINMDTDLLKAFYEVLKQQARERENANRGKRGRRG
jgi:hypothetical protein